MPPRRRTSTSRRSYKLQLRVEVFNPFNVVMLADPDMNASSANFGRIRTSNVNYTPRNIQLGMRSRLLDMRLLPDVV